MIPGSHSGGAARAVARSSVAAPSTQPRSPVHETTVVDSSISAKNYGEQIAAMENGYNRHGQLVSDLSPIPAHRFTRSFNEYRRYAEDWAVRLGNDVRALTATLRAGNRVRARSEWDAAFAAYLHLGATYGLLPDAISNRIDGLPPYLASRHFPGLHRIEMGLWTGERVRSLVPVATRLSAAVVTLRHVLRTTQLDPLDYVARGHEVLEDAQRDYLSGTQVRWSHEGVLATAAGLAATREIVRTLTPLMRGRDNTLGTTQYWLARVDAVLRGLRRRNGSYPTLPQLSVAQSQRLNGAVAGALSQLQEIPSTLETVTTPVTPSIPRGR